MISTSAWLLLSGENFSPADAETATGVFFSSKNERGEIGVKGRYANLPTPFGSAVFELPRSSTNELLDYNKAPFQPSNLLAEFRSAGAVEIVLYIDIAYREQCNFECSPTLLASLAKLGITTCFSCFRD